ncbi:type II toxin-antitoxin system antitoxin DNA ADP-ribosyl glycohydrolase DarG [Brevibacillus fluminis]|uniref:type II toxin-antitoxin system antitoxin DNA ADP-ribosyl glycohydrolase DarG n=1 Tax=Brevibacillus fluminis TaxID=511487 RepID=UPI003F8A70F8
MIKFVKGNMFDSDAVAIVNTVNCVGIMGKGIALEVKKRYPSVFDEYKMMCDRKELKPGIMQTVPTESIIGIQYIINFPTKRHWKAKSKIEDIELGLVALVKEIKKYEFKSIALPPLGCGNGGLNWKDVKPLVIRALQSFENVEILVFEPENYIDNDVEVKSNNQISIENKPKLTEGRRDLLDLLLAYTKENFVVSVHEIHNLAFILQSAGHSLNLSFVPSINGLFSEGLNPVLSKLNGYYFNVLSQPNKTSLIRIKEDELYNNASINNLFQESTCKVLESIRGYRSEAGLELFSKVLWEVLNLDNPNDINLLMKNVFNWKTVNEALYREIDVKKLHSHLMSCSLFSFKQ